MSYISHKKPPNKLAIVSTLLVVVLGLIGWAYWRNSHKAGEDGLAVDPNPEIASPQEIESGYAESLAGFLETEDYEQYQISARSIARHYLSISDFASAERVILDVLSKVPDEKIESSTLILAAAIYKESGNVDKHEEYLNKAAQRLRAEGHNDEADALFTETEE